MTQYVNAFVNKICNFLFKENCVNEVAQPETQDQSDKNLVKTKKTCKKRSGKGSC